MTYRDMTFCPFWESCIDGEDCYRRLPDNIPEGVWVSQFMEHPECYKEIEDEVLHE